ncbi:MAG: AbrB/MazE/SpoVT family DNA-binding domain-containing protein [Phycisphaerae bacterium]|nr:AbrB/MazE/SpoVT family DNA-binding domain-containing protein [Phycisphaerae bacterium]
MRLTAKGQVAIPAHIRRKMGFLPGTEIEFVMSGTDVILRQRRSGSVPGRKLVSAMRARATVKMSTDQIMRLTRAD